ncbi:MAG: hypothetical protein ACUVSQ_07900, partial [Pseudanabaenaceae cyanobacterium]
WEEEGNTLCLYAPNGELLLTYSRPTESLTFQDRSIPVVDIQALRRHITTDEEGDRQETLWLNTTALCWLFVGS